MYPRILFFGFFLTAQLVMSQYVDVAGVITNTSYDESLIGLNVVLKNVETRESSDFQIQEITVINDQLIIVQLFEDTLLTVEVTMMNIGLNERGRYHRRNNQKINK